MNNIDEHIRSIVRDEVKKALKAQPTMIPGMGVIGFPGPESLAKQARELAEQKAEEEGVAIDQICVMGTPFGLQATVLQS